jgi:hypothetical protein
LSSFKTTLAINNVNNTSDLTKPISTATQTVLDLKLNAADTVKYTKQSWADSALLTKFNLKDTVKYTKQTFTDSALLTKLSITGNAATATSATTATSAGTATTATKLATARTINGVAFDGSADINITSTADAGNLTGTSLKSTVTGSSLTSVGTLANLTVTNPIVGSITGNAATATIANTATTAGTATTATKLATARTINEVAFDGSGDITVVADAGTLSGTTLNSTVTSSSLTTLGILANATVNGKVIVGASEEETASAVLEASSTTQGFLPPRMTISERNNINSPVAGLMIWNSTLNRLEVYDGSFWVNMNGIISVGQPYQGGIIAYILQSGDPGYDANTPHGLIAAASDLGYVIRWWNGSNTITGATGTAIGTGRSNTNAIIASQGDGYYAAKICADYSVSVEGVVYDDWYLPSKDELKKLYINRFAIEPPFGFLYDLYFSSTELSNWTVWTENLENGNGGSDSKNYSRNVRAIRAF